MPYARLSLSGQTHDMPSTHAKLEQARLSFAVISSPAQHQPSSLSASKSKQKGKAKATNMATPSPSKDEMADGWKEVDASTPIKKSNVAVVIYTPNKTHILRDGAPKYLPTPVQSSQQMPEGADRPCVSSELPELDLSLDNGAKCRTTSSAPRLRRTHERLRLQAEKKEANAQKLDSTKKPTVVSVGSSPHSVMEFSSDEDASSEQSHNPARRRAQKAPTKPSHRPISGRSFISDGSTDNAPISPSLLETSKGTRTSKNRTTDSSSKKPAHSRPSKMAAIPAWAGTTRIGVRMKGRTAVQDRDKEADEEQTGQSAEKASKRDRNGVSEDEDDVVISRIKRRRPRLDSSDRAVSSGLDGREVEDSEGEQEGGEKGPRTRRHDRGAKPRKSRKQKLFEELRNRRAGKPSAKGADLPSSSESDEVPKRALYDTDSEDDFQVLNDDDGEEDEESGTEAIRKTLRGSRNNEYDKDFVVSDDEETLGVPSYGPGRLDIPIEFTLRAHKKMKEHFKDAIEWMVHNKLNPAFDRNDGIYRVAFSKLDTEALAYSSSKFVSSVWTPKFTRSLKSRPDLYREEITPGEKDCEACNRTNHSATFRVQFSGKPYYRDSLEEVLSLSNDDGGEEDLAKDLDSEGNSVPDATTIFYVGKVCYQNAQTAHSLMHWRYHLNDWVVDELEKRGLFEPNEILKRESWGSKKRSTSANEIVDDLEKKGEIGILYRDFKTNLKEARNAKPGRFKK